jgi:hypothetical protein
VPPVSNNAGYVGWLDKPLDARRVQRPPAAGLLADLIQGPFAVAASANFPPWLPVVYEQQPPDTKRFRVTMPGIRPQSTPEAHHILTEMDPKIRTSS